MPPRAEALQKTPSVPPTRAANQAEELAQVLREQAGDVHELTSNMQALVTSVEALLEHRKQHNVADLLTPGKLVTAAVSAAVFVGGLVYFVATTFAPTARFDKLDDRVTALDRSIVTERAETAKQAAAMQEEMRLGFAKLQGELQRVGDRLPSVRNAP